MDFPAQTPRRCTVHKGLAALSRLRHLAVPHELLILAAQQGFVERLNAERPFDPTTAAGTDAWRYAVRTLRAGLERRGWRLDDVHNLPLAISDDHGVNLTVSSGDKFTGIEGTHPPKSRHPKGGLIKAAIARNTRQGDLFPDSLSSAVRHFHQTLVYPTWVLLLHITDDAIQAELSLPSSIDEDDYVDGWAERILISVPLPDAEMAEVPDIDDGPEIVPVVTPKF